VDERRHLAIVADACPELERRNCLPGLYLVDLSTRTVKGVVQLGHPAEGVATDPALGLALSVDPQAGTLVLTDLTTQAVEATLPVGKQPLAVAVDPFLHLAAVLDEDSGTLQVVDLLARRVARSVKLGAGLVALAIEPSSHQAVVLQEDRLLVVELLTGKLSGILALPAPGTALAVLPDPAWAVVALQTPAGIVLVDLASLQILATLPLQHPSPSVAVHPDWGESLALDAEQQALLRHDLETRALRETIPLGNLPLAIAVDTGLQLALVTVQTPTGGALQLVQLSEPEKASPLEATPPTPPATTRPLAAGPPTQDFTITLTPSTTTTVSGGTVAFQVTLTTSDGKPLSGKADLTVSGLPVGVKAAFQPPVLAGGSETSTLTLDVGTVAAGTYPFTVTATAKEGTKTASGSLMVLPAGTTALAGQILETGKQPLPHVTIRLGSLSTKTDAGGNFLLLTPPTGDQLVFLDGSTASTATAVYPLIPVKVTIVKGQVTPLPYTPHLHAQKTKDFVDIRDKGKERKHTDPALPGFELRLPPGAEIIGWDGKPNERVTVKTLPSDRLPIPLPPTDNPTQPVYMFYFDKPGGGVANRPIPLTTPNDLRLQPGELTQLFYFDEAPNLEEATFTWQPAGWGRVSDDGTRIEPLPGTGLPRFCCGAALYLPNAKNSPSNSPDDSENEDGDPVDLGTGYFILRKTDLVVKWRIPVVIRRYWRSGDATAGPFGPGTWLSYDWYVGRYGTNNENAILITAGNYQYTFVKQGDGSYRNATNPTFRGAKLTFARNNTATLRMKDGMTYGFDANGLLISQTDRNGNQLAFLREVDTNITKIQDSTGRTLVTLNVVISCCGRDFYQAVTDLSGRQVRYFYLSGRLTAVTYPDGSTHRYQYDSAGRIATITDARGITFLRNEYDANGRVIRQTQADGSTYAFQYTLDANGNVTQTVLTNPNGNQTTHRFNAGRYRSAVVDALGQTTTHQRDSTNLLTAVTDPLGRTTRFAYDSLGNVTSITDAAGNVTKLTYETTYSRLTSLTNPLGQMTSFGYDTKGNMIKITDPLGNAWQIGYNNAGLPGTFKDPLGNTRRFEYDSVGNLTATVDPLGNRTTRTYDVLARLLSVTNALGHTTRFDYDLMNRVTQIADALGGVTRMSYDGNGNRTALTDAKGNTVQNAYDFMDRLATRSDPLGRTETFAYDGNGNLTAFTDRKGQTRTFTYDALNRRTQAMYPGATVSYTWDAGNRLTQLTDSQSGALTWSYDVLNRLTQESSPLGSITYTYDAARRRTSMTVTGQPAISYGYDAAGRQTSVQQGSQTVTATYDKAGRRAKLTRPNNVTTTYSYDAAGRVMQVWHQKPGTGKTVLTLEDVRYQYDAVGNRTSHQRTAAHPPLPSAIGTTLNEANQMLSLNDKTLTYDLNGNLTQESSPAGVKTYNWDGRNRLSGITGSNLTASFKYDALGRRMEKTVNGITTQYLYDGFDIIAELQNGAVTATYLRSLNIDEPFSRTKGTSTVHYLQDALGSVVGLADGAGTLATVYAYDAFGAVTTSGASSDQPFKYTGREDDGTGLYYYRARYYDPELRRFVSSDPLDLTRIMVIKQYNPSSFVNRVYRTVLLNPEFHNEYTYVVNDPIGYTDPLGYRGILPGITGGSGEAVGGVVGAVTGGMAGAAAGAALGMELGFAIGGAIGLGAGPLGSLGGAIVGGMVGEVAGGLIGGLIGAAIGGEIGSWFDDPCAGQLNCNEIDPSWPSCRK
jgi:RHS repeat-associated protein